jgi:hypothetical protein
MATTLPTVGNSYYIVNKRSGKHISVDSGSLADMANIVQYVGQQGDNQKWNLVDAGNGYFYIVNKRSGKHISVDSGSLADMANIVQYVGQQGDNQKWNFEVISPPVPTSGQFQVPTNSITGFEFSNKLSKDSSYKFTPSGTWKPKADIPDCTAAGLKGFGPEIQTPLSEALKPYQENLKYPNNTTFALLAVNKTTGKVIEVSQETTIILKPGETLTFLVNDFTPNYGDNTGTLTVKWSAS